MIRLFIAWPLAPIVEQALGEIMGQLKTKEGRVTWVVPHNIHLTARFLGDSDEGAVTDLKSLIDQVASHNSKSSLTLDKLGAFPDMKRPRVIWAGLAGDIAPLQKTVDEIERGFQELGFPPESKRFNPHLTLGRIKDSHGIDGVMTMVHKIQVPKVSVVLDRLVLFKSTLTPKGSIYERLHERGLGESATFGG